MSTFADLGVTRPVADALSRRGITAPFAVQKLVIEDVLDGHDVLVQSPTGSGKTLAFGVPLVECIEADDQPPAALVLAPTRELALQIVEEVEPIAAARGLRVAPVYGGAGLEKQARRAARAQILVATPGRLEDLLDRGTFELSELRILVIDEADRMLDMGFKPAVDRIVAKTPHDRQTLFFSATLEAAAGRVARAYTDEPRRHVHEPVEEDMGKTSHRFVHLEQAGKIDALVDELRDAERGRTLVFVRTKHGADRLVKRLLKQRVRAVAMHGNKIAEPAQPRPGAVLGRRRRHAGGHRRRRPRHRRRRHHPRDQLRRPRRPRRVRPQGRAHRARRPRRGGGHLRALRPGRRDAQGRPRPRTDRGVRAQPPGACLLACGGIGQPAAQRAWRGWPAAQRARVASRRAPPRPSDQPLSSFQSLESL